jgi:hypothetical protein
MLRAAISHASLFQCFFTRAGAARDAADSMGYAKACSWLRG